MELPWRVRALKFAGVLFGGEARGTFCQLRPTFCQLERNKALLRPNRPLLRPNRALLKPQGGAEGGDGRASGWRAIGGNPAGWTNCTACRRDTVGAAWAPIEIYTYTPGFLIHEFWAGRKSSISGVWRAPGAQNPFKQYAGQGPAYF